MSTTKDGGPAFPRSTHTMSNDYGEQMHGGQDGMTIRDWFAGQALAGIMADNAVVYPTCEGYADFAYRIADAMLASRAKSEAPE